VEKQDYPNMCFLISYNQ